MRTLKRIGVLLLTFVIAFVFASIPCVCLVKFFNEVNIISINAGLWATTISSLIFSGFAIILGAIYLYNDKKTRIVNWFSQNYAKLFLFYVIFCIASNSLKTKIAFEYDGLRDFISTQWAIFGMTITIFLVWNVLILEHLKKHRPQKSDIAFPMETFKYIDEKKEFYQTATERFNSISLLIINLILLVITTSSAYVSNDSVTLFNQNLSIASFYFSSNTLISLFFDILSPLKDEKKNMLKNMKVTDAEIRLQNHILEKLSSTVLAIEKIDEDADMTLEEKRLQRVKLLYRFTGDSDILKDEDLLRLWEEK